MTVASTTNRVSYAGNGTTTDFAFPHPYRASSDLVVTLRTTATGAEVAQVEGVNYTVSGTPTSDAGGFASATVSFGTAPASGTQVHIDRIVARTQTTDYVAGDGIPPSSIEGSLDKLTQLVQELDSRFERTLLQPRTAANRNLVLPEPTSGSSGRVIGINDAGSAYELRLAGMPPMQFFDTATAVAAATVNPNLNWIRTAGYYAVGDGGGALYKRVGSIPSHGAYISSVGPAYWSLADTTVNVKACGAKGDNTGNDAPAINTAIALCKANGGGIVYAPEGTYRCTSSITFDFSNFSFVGDGRTATIINFASTASKFDVAKVFDVRLRGFSVINATGDGIVMGETTGTQTYLAYFTVSDLATNNIGGRGFSIGAAYMGNITALRVQASTGIGIDCSTGFKTSLHFSDCHAFSGLTDGWKVKNATYLSFVACGSDYNDGYGYWLENIFNSDFHGSAESNDKAALRFNYLSTTPDLVKGFAGLRINLFEKDNNLLAGATGQFAHFVGSGASSYAGQIIFDGCAHYTTPTGNAMQFDSGNYHLIMPPSRNRIKRSNTGASFCVISDGAGDVPHGLPVNVTGAGTAIANLRAKLRNGVLAYGGMLVVYVTNNNLGSGARSASYVLALTRAVGTSSITQIAATGNTTGATTDSASFTFALDTTNQTLTVSPVGSTATGNWYFHITAHGNIDVEMI